MRDVLMTVGLRLTAIVWGASALVVMGAASVALVAS